MITIKWKSLFVLLIFVGLCGSVPDGGASPTQPLRFRAFDATLYTNKPDFENLGLESIRVIYSGELWDRNEDRKKLPREERVALLARGIASNTQNKLAVIDIEHWPWVEHRGDVRLGMENYMTVLEWFKKYAPSVRFAYYTVPPVPDFDNARAGESTWRYHLWQKQNDQIALLAQASQALFPSLYSFSPNREDWVKSAISHIREARRYGTGVPVYVFLWPQYHEITRGQPLAFIDREFWRIQLETAKQYADGVVIWGGWDLKKNKPMIWDDSAPWWLETVSFLNQNQSALR
jgi:hypothetical protein